MYANDIYTPIVALLLNYVHQSSKLYKWLFSELVAQSVWALLPGLCRTDRPGFEFRFNY